MAYLPQAAIAVGRRSCWPAAPIPQVAAAVGARLADSRRRGARPRRRAAFPTDHDLSRLRLEPYSRPTARAHPDRAEALHAAGRGDAAGKALSCMATSAPRTSWSARGAGVPRCRMRLVRRPGLRSGLLPQPPAAEVPLRARRRPQGFLGSSMRWRLLSRRRGLGACGRARGARRRPPARPVPGRVDGKSPVDTSPRRPTGSRTPVARLLLTGRSTARRVRAAWREQLADGRPTLERPPSPCRPPRLGLARPADRRGRGKSRRRRGRARHRAGRRLDRRRRGARSPRRRRLRWAVDVQGAVAAVNDVIAPALAGLDAADQAGVDARLIALDGTPDKARLGGNAVIAASMAVAHAAAAAAESRSGGIWRAGGTPCRCRDPDLGGGAHAGRRVDMQDLLIVSPGAASFRAGAGVVAEVYRGGRRDLSPRRLLRGRRRGWRLARVRHQRGGARLRCGRSRRRQRPVEQIGISLDVAASQFGSSGRYRLARDGRDLVTGAPDWAPIGWFERYPIISLETPWLRTIWREWRRSRRPSVIVIQIIGDDFLSVTYTAIRVRDAAATRRLPTPCWSSPTRSAR